MRNLRKVMEELKKYWQSYLVFGLLSVNIAWYQIFGKTYPPFLLLSSLMFVLGFILPDLLPFTRTVWGLLLLPFLGFITYIASLAYHFYPNPANPKPLELFFQDYVYVLVSLVFGTLLRVSFERAEGREIRII